MSHLYESPADCTKVLVLHPRMRPEIKTSKQVSLTGYPSAVRILLGFLKEIQITFECDKRTCPKKGGARTPTLRQPTARLAEEKPFSTPNQEHIFSEWSSMPIWI